MWEAAIQATIEGGTKDEQVIKEMVVCETGKGR